MIKKQTEAKKQADARSRAKRLEFTTVDLNQKSTFLKKVKKNKTIHAVLFRQFVADYIKNN